MVQITEKASRKITDLLKKDGLAGGVLRIKVTPGGCSGLSYDLSLVPSAQPQDHIFENNGAKVAVETKSLSYMDNSTLDYVESLQNAGFKITNPKVKASCFCGESFSV